MMPHIIHNRDRLDRKEKLIKELESQNIGMYRQWDAIHDTYIIQRGINKAHKQIVQWAKDKKLKEVLIFEDDIHFTCNDSFNYYLQKKPSDYDLYMGGIYLGQIINGQVEKFTGLHCYMVNERFYDTFLATSEEEHLDGALAEKGKFMVCEPFIAIQYNGYSDNEKRYCNYDIILETRSLYKKE